MGFIVGIYSEGVDVGFEVTLISGGSIIISSSDIPVGVPLFPLVSNCLINTTFNMIHRSYNFSKRTWDGIGYVSVAIHRDIICLYCMHILSHETYLQ